MFANHQIRHYALTQMDKQDLYNTCIVSQLFRNQRAKLTLTRWPEASSFQAGPVILKSNRSGGPVSILNAYRSCDSLARVCEKNCICNALWETYNLHIIII